MVNHNNRVSLMVYYWMKYSLIYFWLTTDRTFELYAYQCYQQVKTVLSYVLYLVSVSSSKPTLVEDWSTYHYVFAIYSLISIYLSIIFIHSKHLKFDRVMYVSKSPLMEKNKDSCAKCKA